MHIAFLTSEYPPLPCGGIGTNVRNLARAMVAAGHRVTVIGWGPQTAFEDEGVRVRFLGHTRLPKLGWFLNRRRAAREINRLVREEGLDIVEAADWCGMSAGLRPAASGKRQAERGQGLAVQGSGTQRFCSSPDNEQQATDNAPAASRLPLAPYRLAHFLVRHCGFSIACPLVIRCNGSATYFAYLQQLQDRLQGVPGGWEDAIPLRRRCQEYYGTTSTASNEQLPLSVKPLVRWTEGLALRQASSIVAVSRFCADTTAELFGLEERGSGFRVQGSGAGAGDAHESNARQETALDAADGPAPSPSTSSGPSASFDIPKRPWALGLGHWRFRPPPSAFRLPPLPIGVIPNGIDIRQFAPARPEDVEPHTLLYVGTLARKKGVLDLPAIFNRVVEQVPQARLRLIGRDNPDVRTGARSTWELMRRGFSPAALARVEYLGVTPYAVVQDFVRRAAVCVFPSYAEALPLSWLEAMACAKPVVAYDMGWAQEVVKAGVSGSLARLGNSAEFADAVVACLRNPQRAADMGLAARQRVQRYFAADVVAQQSVDWYASVCQGW